MATTCTSKSTDKLAIICETIKDRILNDDTLKTRVKCINITWDNVEVGSKLEADLVACPYLNIEFKD